MLRALRYLLCLIAGLTAVFLVLLATGLDEVDATSYLRAPYYAKTVKHLQATVATNHLVRGELAAGLGRALLSPILHAVQDDPIQGRFKSLPLAGYGERHGKPARGVYDDLYVKAVAIRVNGRLGVVVSADALIVPAEVTDLALNRLGAELRLTRDQVYLSATHTHSSLGGWGEGKVAEGFAGGFQPGVRVWFADRIVAAAREAVADLRPAALGQGRFIAPELIRNRLVGQAGKIDPEFVFTILRQSEGKSAVLGCFAAHATVLSGDNFEFSGDYPGSWQRAIEQATGGLAVFLAGGMGSHSPVPPEKGFAGAEQMGQALARRLLAQWPRELTNQVAFGLVGIPLELPPPNVRVSDGIRLRPWLARRVLPLKQRTFLQAFRIGDTIWLSAPCDFSGELALGIKEHLRAEGLNAAVTSFNGDYIGYVIPLRYYHLSGYEPRFMSFFGPNVPDYFEDVMIAMGDALSGG